MSCEEKEKPGVLEACVSKGQRLADMVECTENSFASETFLDKPGGLIALFGFERGQI